MLCRASSLEKVKAPSVSPVQAKVHGVTTYLRTVYVCKPEHLNLKKGIYHAIPRDSLLLYRHEQPQTTISTMGSSKSKIYLDFMSFLFYRDT